MTPCLTLLCFMVFGPPALALGDGVAAPARPALSPVSIQAYGRGTTCTDWTDSCTVCTRTALEPAACSTPGIACTPGPIVCRATAP